MSVDLRDLFERATGLAPEQRTAFLERECGDDRALHAEVCSLLAADADAAGDTFWQHSALRNQILADGIAIPDLGATIGPYRLVERIGQGGMGTVYRAERIDAAFEKSVAIKLINGLFQSADVIAQFRSERQILANLDHPNIARLLDGGTLGDGLPYLVMDYVEGVAPGDYCRQHDLSTNQRLVLFQQICAAVHYAHQNMVIHRDLKPANILVCADGTPRLLDFGIAKVFGPDGSPGGLDAREGVTAPGMLKLTARYASPEQVRGDPVTTASDVYSLGVILYELLSGHSPYGDQDRAPHQVMQAVCEEEPLRPSTWLPRLKGDLDNIVLRALRKQPGERYASADQFSEDITRYLEQRPVLARGDARWYVAARFVARNRVAVVAASLTLCALLGALVMIASARNRAERRFEQVHRLAHAVIFDYADAIGHLPGSTPVRQRLVGDALATLDSLSHEAETPQLQREIVDAYVRISDIQGNEYDNNLGNTAGALASAQKAVVAAGRLLAIDRTLPALGSAAAAWSAQGSLHYAAGDLVSADRDYRRAIELREAVARQQPGDLDNRLALVAALDQLGDLYGGVGLPNLGRARESRAAYDRAEAEITRLVARYPDNIDVLKQSYETLMQVSAAENAAGQHAAGLRDLGLSLDRIAQVAAREPHDTTVRHELANGEARLGQMLLDDRQAATALPHFVRSVGLLQALSAADPANATFRRGQSVVENQWAAALRGKGQPGAALAHNERSVAIARALRDDAPGSAQYRMDVGITERKLSEGLLAVGKVAPAVQVAQDALRILCEPVTATTDAGSRAHCERAQLAAGNAWLAQHQARAAAAILRRAVTSADAQVRLDPGSAIARSDAARAQAALAEALAQTGDRAGAVAMFVAALNSWATLRQAGSITAEDQFRSERAAAALRKVGGVNKSRPV